MEIEPVAPGDWPWLLSRSAATAWAQVPTALQAHSNPQIVAQSAEAMLLQSVQRPGVAVLVARQGKDPVGYLIGTVVPDELTQMPTGLFLDIWVEPVWRGKGVSSALTKAGEEHFRSLGIRLVRRWIAAHNQASLRHAQRDGCQVERLALVKWL